jgi:hypothetical protein
MKEFCSSPLPIVEFALPSVELATPNLNNAVFFFFFFFEFLPLGPKKKRSVQLIQRIFVPKLPDFEAKKI